MPGVANEELIRSPYRNKKSVFIAYFLWLFGGIFGMHHYYLGRVRHGFVWWTTLGGFGMGWMSELPKISRYVKDANEDPEYMAELIRRMQRSRKPPFSVNRLLGMVFVSYSWSQLTMNAIPQELVYYISLRYLSLLVPLASALGVWTVGNIGRQRGPFIWPLIGAYLTYPIRYYIYDETMSLLVMSISSALLFDAFSKRWDRRPSRHHISRCFTVVLLCSCLYIFLWGNYLYFNGTVNDGEGNEIPVFEALHTIFTSQWWFEVKQYLHDIYTFAQHHGWYELWKQLTDISDPNAEQKAYEVLNLSIDSTQKQITSTWRRLSRENHPDKVKDETLRRQAQERFMEIQHAYELLSKSKNRRSRLNKKDNSVPVSF